MKRLSIITVFLLAVLSCIKDPAGERIKPGESLPAFSVTTLEGKTVSTSDLLGKPSAVILFSTTCPDCHRQLPALESLWRSHADRLNVMAIERSEDAGTVASFWSSASYTMPAAAPGNRSVYDLFDRGSGTGVPQVYVSDAAGTVLITGDDRNLLDEETILRAAFPDNK